MTQMDILLLEEGKMMFCSAELRVAALVMITTSELTGYLHGARDNADSTFYTH